MLQLKDHFQATKNVSIVLTQPSLRDLLKVPQKKRTIPDGWAIEVEGIEAHHGIDVEAELAAILSEEIRKEMEQEIIKLEDGRKVFYTDVGKLPPEKVAEYIALIRANFEAIQCQS